MIIKLKNYTFIIQFQNYYTGLSFLYLYLKIVYSGRSVFSHFHAHMFMRMHRVDAANVVMWLDRLISSQTYPYRIIEKIIYYEF